MNHQISAIDTQSLPRNGGALFPGAMIDPDNPLLRTDNYKISHPAMGLPGATRTSAYIEARRDWDGI